MNEDKKEQEGRAKPSMRMVRLPLDLGGRVAMWPEDARVVEIPNVKKDTDGQDMVTKKVKVIDVRSGTEYPLAITFDEATEALELAASINDAEKLIIQGE